MKVLLVAPVFGYRQKPLPLLSVSDFPAGLAYVAGALKAAGHMVVGLNPNNSMAFESGYYLLTQRLFEALSVEKPDLIGLGGICTDYSYLRDAVELCRRFAPGTPIVLGGGIICNDREFIFDLLHPDYGIVGEGEETILALIHAMEGRQYLSNVANLSWWDGERAVHNSCNHNYLHLDDRPLPDYEVFGVQDMLDNYSMATRLLYRYPRQYARPFPVVTARGCPFNCSFCVHRGGPHYRARSIPAIMEEIRLNYERYRFNILLILDELFAVNKARMTAFCEAILEGKQKYSWDFDWTFQTHASAALDAETLALAKRAGCFFFSYGLESAAPAVLESMNKRTKPEQIEEAIRLAREAGIGFGGNLIFGDVAETQDTIYESLRFFFKHCGGAFVFLGFLMPYPGNKLFDTCVERGIIRDKALYYANIDEAIPNMTRMPDQVWQQWVNFIVMLEHSWLWVRDTAAVVVEKEDSTDSVWRIEADCPYCGKRTVYREMTGHGFLGTGCIHCNQRIRIILPTPEVSGVVQESKECAPA